MDTQGADQSDLVGGCNGLAAFQATNPPYRGFLCLDSTLLNTDEFDVED
jgi:hypothetical protein